jgi:hypothetical protein
MAGDDLAVIIDQDRIAKAELRDAVRNLPNLACANASAHC